MVELLWDSYRNVSKCEMLIFPYNMRGKKSQNFTDVAQVYNRGQSCAHLWPWWDPAIMNFAEKKEIPLSTSYNFKLLLGISICCLLTPGNNWENVEDKSFRFLIVFARQSGKSGISLLLAHFLREYCKIFTKRAFGLDWTKPKTHNMNRLQMWAWLTHKKNSCQWIPKCYFYRFF